MKGALKEDEIACMKNLPHKGKIHYSDDGKQEKSDCVGFVEEIQGNVIDGTLIHRNESLLIFRDFTCFRR